MDEFEWVVCKGCGKIGWLNVHLPMCETGWNIRWKYDEENEAELTFHLCDSCDCLNCPEAHHDTYADESGIYPGFECQFDDGFRCIHLQPAPDEVEK